MKKDLTELVFILDKSGSMNGLEKDTIGGYNSLIKKQKNEKGEALVTTVLFSTETNCIVNRMDINKVKPLTSKEYFASGCTALLDAVGETITSIKREQEKLKENEKPENTIVVITTDGLENASREYSYDKVKELISSLKEKENWEFLFLGANIDVTKEANKIGINPDFAAKYDCNEAGIDESFSCVCETLSLARKEKRIPKFWKKKITKN